MAGAATPLLSRMIRGALAGTVATLPMTAAMNRLHRRLDKEDRYPLPPREIVGSVAPGLPEDRARDASVVAHFAYGALCGAAIAAVERRPSQPSGIAAGVGIWLASYLGWIPAMKIFNPADDHPAPRNAAMILAHVAWGSAYALAQAELLKSDAIFKDGPLKDVPATFPHENQGF